MNWANWGRHKRKRIKDSEIPRAVKALVEHRQGGWFCVMCKELRIVTPPDVPLELDHKLPLSKGGTYNHLNLQVLCRSHNRGRGARGLKPFLPTHARRKQS